MASQNERLPISFVVYPSDMNNSGDLFTDIFS